MLATMISVNTALLYRDRYFARLRNSQPANGHNSMSVSRTHSAIETEIEWNERRYLLMVPFRTEGLRHIEELQTRTRSEGLGALIENQILYDELLITDSFGNNSYLPVILQDTTNGIVLTDAVKIFNGKALVNAVEQMKQRLDAIGFDHKNLRPSNILIYGNGTARPLRYWYAEWGDEANNNIDEALAYIHQHEGIGERGFAPEDIDEEHCDREYEGIRRVFHRNKYGFVDSDGQVVTPCIYSFAGHFHEGRAIVCKNGKMGAIDNEGHSVVPIVYKSLRFDIHTGLFYAYDGVYHYTLNYEGEILQRRKFEGGGFLIAESVNQK